MAEDKREAALQRWLDTVTASVCVTQRDKDLFRYAYDAALADNAERVRQHKLDADTAIDSLREAEEQLAEARSIADRPLGTHIDYEPMDMIRDLQKALGTRVHDREPCRCGNVKALSEARATIEAKSHGLFVAEQVHKQDLEKLAEARATIERLDGRRREGRQLLRRMVKYAREDRAETPGTTRLARLTEQVDDYLTRTEDPMDILRTSEPTP